MASPSLGEAGKTGQWRTQRPVIDHSRCIPEKNNTQGCLRCWLYCPEAVIPKSIPVEINLTYCKGCGLCAAECASGAITMVPEAEAARNEKVKG